MRTGLIAAAVTLGMLGSAQAAVAAPYVASAKFVKTSGSFYSAFGDVIDVRIGGSMPPGSWTLVCVSNNCRGYYSAHVNTAGSAYGQFWRHGSSRLVHIYACRPGSCMTNLWTRQLSVP